MRRLRLYEEGEMRHARSGKPTVAILTTFYEVMSGFSVVTVATNQIHQLLDHGYVPRVLVQEGMPTRDAAGT